jgi:hypothetical protein
MTMTPWLLSAGLGLVVLAVVYRSIGWIRSEIPMADLKQDSPAFQDLIPRYRQTQAGKRERAV